MKSQPKNILIIVLLFLIGLIVVRIIRTIVLDSMGPISLELEFYIKSAFNVVYVIGSYLLIKKYKLIELGGLGKLPVKNWGLFLFPLYIVLINVLFGDDVDFSSIPWTSYLALAAYVLSIGFSEEYMLRGFLQSILLKRFTTSKKSIYGSVLGAGVIFGLLHLIQFDKGLYGEISQLFFDTFIGVMFGAILLRTNKLWPLIIIHALIDFAAKLDGLTPVEEITETTSQGAGSAIITILLLSPCLFYGLILLRKVEVTDIEKKIIE